MGRDGSRLPGRRARPVGAHVRGARPPLRAGRDLTGLEGAVIEYEVELDGEQRLAARRGRPSAAARSTPARASDQARLVFGSCRVGAPAARAVHAAAASTSRATASTPCGRTPAGCRPGIEPWPDALLLIGDQVYADEVSPETPEFIRSRRDMSRAARRGGRRLRGVHPPLPRGVERPRHPLAALDRPERS